LTTELRRDASATTMARLPLVLRWDATRSLPVRPVQEPAGRRAGPGAEAPPWLLTGPPTEPFDFCGHVRRLCADIIARCPAFHHLRLDNLLFGMTQARTGRRHGLQARVTPLRFPGGRFRTYRRGHWYQVQRYVVEDRDILYLVTFCLPRFLDQDFDDKFITLFHELYHISPTFDGDLRRHGGRCSIHTHSMKAYDRRMAELAREYLASKPDPHLHAFLRLNFAQLMHRHRSVVAVVVPQPKLVPVVGVDGDS
jgi:predicted metallopeptidase